VEATVGEQPDSEAAKRLFDAWERWDLDTIESLLADHAVDSRPQSGERFVGPKNISGMYREVPGPPKITWRSVRGCRPVWVAEGIVEYGEGPVHLVGVVEIEDGKLVKANYYFADPFDPPADRARWRAAPTADPAADQGEPSGDR
jgi:hypothetical protein